MRQPYAYMLQMNRPRSAQFKRLLAFTVPLIKKCAQDFIGELRQPQ